MKNLYLVDISSFVFRAYYAITPLATSKGVATHATYGVINMLYRLIRQKKPDGLVIVFDSKTPSFRKEIDPNYKANRDLPPEDLSAQFEHVKEFCQLYPICWLEKEGYEADDIFATIVTSIQRQKNPVYDQITIVSQDKDLMQLIGPKVGMYDPMRERTFGREEVVKKFGVPPEKLAYILALSGDSSDNIPGVAGVGPKTAAKLVNQYESLDGIYENIDELKGKQKERLVNDKSNAYLSLKLVHLCEEVPLELKEKEYGLEEANYSLLDPFFEELELHSLVQNKKKQAEKQIQHTYSLLDTKQKLIDWLSDIQTGQAIAIDTETDGLDTHHAKLVGISLAKKSDKAAYIPIAHKDQTSLISMTEIKTYLDPLFTDPQRIKWFHHAKFDLAILERAGFAIKGPVDDTMVGSYLLNPEGSHKLDNLALEYLNHEMIAFTDVVEKKQTFADVALDKACDYASEDAAITLGLSELIVNKLKEKKLDDCYQKIEKPLILVLNRMESAGVFVDQAKITELGKTFQDQILKLEKQIYQTADTEFNINSTQQLGQILFEKLNLPIIKKTKTGYSTDNQVLTTLASAHELPQLVLEYRKLAKLNSTYIEQLKKLKNPQTNRIHTSYQQTVVATGRLSSTKPNLQNIPIRSQAGRLIRQAFRAQDSHDLILSADYSQIELRLLAALSGDQKLIDAFQKDLDIHRLTASEILNKPLDQITSNERALAKTINFGILYGQSAFGLAQMLGIPNNEAKKHIDSFYQKFPTIKNYRAEVLAKVKQEKKITTWSGRVRYVPQIQSQNRMLVQNAQRVAFNTLFQGSAADVIKLAMIETNQFLIKENLKTKMVMQVHDELVFEVNNQEKEIIEKNVRQIMEGIFNGPVKLKVSISSGQNWDEAH